MNAQGINTDAGTIERILKRLIARHGIERLDAELARIMPRMTWADWQTIHNAAQRITNKRKS